MPTFGQVRSRRAGTVLERLEQRLLFSSVSAASVAITSAGSHAFLTASAGTFSITTTGAAAPVLSEVGKLPSGIAFQDNGDGTGELLGTPAVNAGGRYPLKLIDASGSIKVTQLFTLTIDQPPAISTATAATFITQRAANFAFKTVGYPAPVLTEVGLLPAGVVFADNGAGAAALAGAPAAGQAGTYTLTVTAHNGIGSDFVQTFTLTVDLPPGITSASQTTFSDATGETFLVTTTGMPAARLSVSGNLPSGIVFQDNGNGTASLFGTPALFVGAQYKLEIVADNGVTPMARQAFLLTVDEPAVISSPRQVIFIGGRPSKFLVTTFGYPFPLIDVTGVQTLPTGITLTDEPNGAATLAGTPTGPLGTYVLTLRANNGIAPIATQTFTLTVGQPPAITSPSQTLFVTGTLGTFNITTSGFPASAVSESGTLPNGIIFTDNQNGTASLTGTPDAAAGGKYRIKIMASNGAKPDAAQYLTLFVDEAPTITSANHATFTIGQAARFTVTTSGFPAVALGETGVLPDVLGFRDNGNGTASFFGTPRLGAAGTYNLTLLASNAAGEFMQDFTLIVT